MSRKTQVALPPPVETCRPRRWRWRRHGSPAHGCHEDSHGTVHGIRTILLAGNPNSGKSTLFNALTGAHQHVGNWPGKTVELRQGAWHVGGQQLRIIDLPGSYSLNAHTPEEAIARDAILTSNADLVVITADAANLERNLYLVVQILEMNLPVLLALNMWDAACAAGIHIDLGRLALQLGVPVVPTTLSKGEGLPNLQRLALDALGVAGVQPC